MPLEQIFGAGGQGETLAGVEVRDGTQLPAALEHLSDLLRERASGALLGLDGSDDLREKIDRLRLTVGIVEQALRLAELLLQPQEELSLVRHGPRGDDGLRELRDPERQQPE